MRAREAAALLAVGFALAGTWSESCPGQYELGSGNALDANPAAGGSRFNSPVSLPDYRGRNLLVTGNVAGGRGFRGTVGYLAEYDFRGETGSDDLFRERADAAFSAPSFIAARTSMENLRFGQFLNEVEYRTATRGSNLTNFADTPVESSSVFSQRLALDRVAISSTTSSVYASANDAQIVGLLQDEEGRRIAATASSLMGVQLSLVQQQGQLIGLNSYDMARTLEDARAGLGTSIGAAFEVSFRDLLPPETGDTPVDPGRLESDLAATNRIELPVESSYLDIMQRVAEHAQPAGDTDQSASLADLDLQFEALRNQLAGVVVPVDETATGPAAPDGEPAATPGLPESMGGPGGAAVELPKTTAAIEAMAQALRHGLQVGQLSSRDESRFNELMRSAEESLRDGEYFWAERRFERALRFTPGHPLATAGLGHAQIGAGLYLPAALTLRGLLTRHPELIDVQYESSLLPSAARLSLASQRLRELLERADRDRDLHGLLLAYIGHQLKNRDMIAEGLAPMGPTAFKTLLEKVWLEED